MAEVEMRSAGRFGLRTVLTLAALVLLAVPFLVLVLLIEDRSPLLRAFDAGPRDRLHTYALAHPAFVTVMRLVSDTGTTLAWTVVFTPVVVWLLWRRRPRAAVFVVVTVALSSLLNNLAKGLVHRARPVLSDPVAHAGGASFPSGHAQAALVGYGVLLLVLRPVLSTAGRQLAVAGALTMTGLIGFSRVALGVHYLSDVLAGYVLGAAWLVAMTAAFSAWRRERVGSTARMGAVGPEPERAAGTAGDQPAPSGAPTP